MSLYSKDERSQWAEVGRLEDRIEKLEKGSGGGGGTSGDMLKATYDSNNNGIVDNAERVNGLTVETAVPPSAVFTDTTYTVGDGGLTEINFTSALDLKLEGIEDGAQKNVQGAAVADSTATTIAGLKDDFNALLTSLRDAGIIAT